MLKLLSATAMLASLTAGVAVGGDAVYEYGVQIPPAVYGHGAFIAPPVIFHLPSAEVAYMCLGNPAACAMFTMDDGSPVDWEDRATADSCSIFINVDYIGLLMYPALVEHEMGHCRGWPWDHPN
jgi:hypothetical protein